MMQPRTVKTASEAFVHRIVTDSAEGLEKKMDGFEKKMEKRFDKVMTHLVDIAGKFKKFDEEQTVLSSHSKDHTDRIGRLESAVFNPS